MSFILGIDPGKSGAFVLIDEAGEIVKVWDMPYQGSSLSAHGTAQVYQEVLTITRRQVGVFIEKAFTKPTDALSMDRWKQMTEMRLSAAKLAHSWLNYKSGTQVLKSDWDALFADLLAQIKNTVWTIDSEFKYRPDGRLGNFNYAKSAGVLESCAALDMAYVLVSPATWCAAMHKGADPKAKAKEKSRQIIEMRWPEYAKKGSPLYKPRGRKMDDGRHDAFLIAQYGRLLGL